MQTPVFFCLLCFFLQASAGESSLVENLFDMNSRYQGNIMDEQCCALPPRSEMNGSALKPPHHANSTSSENLAGVSAKGMMGLTSRGSLRLNLWPQLV